MAYHARNFDTAAPLEAKADRGRCAFHAGLSAEAQVATWYRNRGYTVLAERWRAGRSEVDLILEGPDCVVFVEVKKSRDFERALSRITRAQVQRIFSAAEVFLGTLPHGSLTPSRFDVALVDAIGNIEVRDNFLAGGL